MTERAYMVIQSFTVHKKPFSTEPERAYKAGEVVFINDLEVMRLHDEYPGCLRLADYCPACGHYW